MKFNVSQIKDHLICPRLSFNRHIIRRGIEKSSVALEFGSLFHTAMEARLRTLEPTDYGPFLEAAAMCSQETMAEWQKAREAVCAFYPRAEWEVRAIEQALDAPLGPHTLQGRLDALVFWNGGWWSLQWKTCANTTSVEKLAEKVCVSWHECAYQYLCEHAGYTPFKGTILGVFKKLSQKRIAEGEQPLSFHYLPRESWLVERRMYNLKRIVDAIEAQGDDPLENADACFGTFGNSKCAYFDCCHDTLDVTQPPFVDLKDRYADPALEEVA